jgi:hypothetical protein
MLAGDDLTIVLFLVGLAATFAVAAMSAAGWRHPALIFGLFGFAVIFFSAGIGWPFLKTISPPTTAIVDQIATNPVAWFVVLILGIMAPFLYVRRNQKVTTSSPSTAKPDIREWFTSTDIGHLGNEKLVLAAKADSERFDELEQQYQNFEAELYSISSANSLMALTSLVNPEPNNISNLKERIRDLAGPLLRQKSKRDASFLRAIDDIHQKLQNGSLIAKGCLAPIESTTEEKAIPAWQWRFLKFNGDLTEASGEGITYKAIAVARA